ncbi:MAG: tetratricopeptide repeat protein [Planctomycetota bacterium]|nr:tetratricopeptide repeat protein [Planctomycetota bacterium]
MIQKCVRRIWLEYLLSRGQRLLSDGHLDRAHDMFSRAIEKNPDHSALRLHRAVVLVRQNENTQALEETRKVTSQIPENSSLNVLAARIHIDAGDPEGARKVAEIASKSSPHNRVARGYLSASLLALDQIEEGLQILEGSEVAEDTNLQARLILEMAKALRRRRLETPEASNNFQSASNESSETISRSSANCQRQALHWLRKGGAAFLQERYDKALDCYARGLEVAPDEFDLHAYTAESLYWKEDFHGAFEALQRREFVRNTLKGDDSPELTEDLLAGPIAAYRAAIHYQLNQLDQAKKQLEIAHQLGVEDTEFTFIQAALSLCEEPLNPTAERKAVHQIASTEFQDPDYLDKKIHQLIQRLRPQ